ncbi:MAG: electron transfer flavoprotein subunit alpha/FixB family protein, partial [Chloroflexi bacterium]
MEGEDARRRSRAQVGQGTALPEPARDHEGEEEGDPRERPCLARGHRIISEDRGRRDGAASPARRREDLQARRRREGRRGAGSEGAARGGEGPVKTVVVAERSKGALRRVSLEIAAKASSFGDTEVIAVKGDRYSPMAWSSAVAEKAKDADLILVGATPNGRDLGARVAAKLGRAYAADCTDLAAKDGALEAKRPMYAGKIRATVKVPSPAVISIRPGAWTLPAGAAAPQVTEIDPAADDPRITFDRFETTASGGKRVSLAEARAIVSAGRGLKGPEN